MSRLHRNDAGYDTLKCSRFVLHCRWPDSRIQLGFQGENMQNPYLDRLQAAAQQSTRPRFASALILVLLAHARENGQIDASRAELAAAVDRSHAYPARNQARAERLVNRQKELDQYLLQLETSHTKGRLTYGEMKQARERAIDSFLKEVRSPTLANVSRVINEFIRAGMLSARYVDAQGEYYGTPAKGRIAEYKLTPPTSSQLSKMPAAASQNHNNITQTFANRFATSSQTGTFNKGLPARQLDLL